MSAVLFGATLPGPPSLVRFAAASRLCCGRSRFCARTAAAAVPGSTGNGGAVMSSYLRREFSYRDRLPAEPAAAPAHRPHAYAVPSGAGPAIPAPEVRA